MDRPLQSYKITRKINFLIYMYDIKLFAKNKKELETLIWAVRMYIAKY